MPELDSEAGVHNLAQQQLLRTSWVMQRECFRSMLSKGALTHNQLFDKISQSNVDGNDTEQDFLPPVVWEPVGWAVQIAE